MIALALPPYTSCSMAIANSHDINGEIIDCLEATITSAYPSQGHGIRDAVQASLDIEVGGTAKKSKITQAKVAASSYRSSSIMLRKYAGHRDMRPP
jgi:hypothetical protein